MTAEQLRIVREANPFRPFIIHLADGRWLPVPHRDYLSLSPSGRTAIVYGPEDKFSIVDLFLVTELQVDGTPRPSNGSAASNAPS